MLNYANLIRSCYFEENNLLMAQPWTSVSAFDSFDSGCSPPWRVPA